MSASWRDTVAAEAPDPVTGMVRPQWLVVCSCGWEREASLAWAAQSVSRQHKQLRAVGVGHITHVEAPADASRGEQLPLV